MKFYFRRGKASLRLLIIEFLLISTALTTLHEAPLTVEQGRELKESSRSGIRPDLSIDSVAEIDELRAEKKGRAEEEEQLSSLVENSEEEIRAPRKPRGLPMLIGLGLAAWLGSGSKSEQPIPSQQPIYYPPPQQPQYPIPSQQPIYYPPPQQPQYPPHQQTAYYPPPQQPVYYPPHQQTTYYPPPLEPVYYDNNQQQQLHYYGNYYQPPNH